MSSKRRAIFIVLAAVVLVIVIPLVLLLSVPKERVRQMVADRLQAALQQPVRIAAADFHLLPDLRLRLTGLEVGAAAGAGKPHLSASAINLRLRLLPLLARHVVIEGIEIDRPRIEEILNATAATAAGGPSAPPSVPLEVSLQSLRINDGGIALKLADGSPLLEVGGLSETMSAHLASGGIVELAGETGIDTLRFHLVTGVLGEGLRLRLQEKLRYDLKSGELRIDTANLDLSGVPVALSGTVQGLAAGAPRCDLHLAGGPGNLRDLVGLIPAQILPPQIQGMQSSGTLSVQGTVTGPAAQPDFHLALSLENGRIQAPTLPQAIEGIALRLRVDPDSVVLSEFAARSAQSSLRARATLVGYRHVPRFQVAAQADLDLGSLSSFYAARSGLEMDGRGSIALIAEGRADQPTALRVEGTARLTGVGLRSSTLPLPVKDLNADLLFSNQDLTLRSSSVRLGSSDFALAGTVHNLGALQPGAKDAGRARAALSLRSRQILFDEMFPTPSKGKVTIPPLPPLDGSVSFRIDRLSLRGTEISQAVGQVTLDQGKAHVEQFSGGVYGGQVGLTGEVDLRSSAHPAYDLTGDARGLAVRDLLAQARSLDRFSGLSGSLSGSLDTHLSLQGTLSDSLLPEMHGLTSKGNLQINQARLSGYPLQKAVSDFLAAPGLQSLQINEWKQGFRIEDGKVNVEALSLKAGPTEALINGWQSIDGQTQMSFDLLVPPDLVSGLRARLSPEAASLLFAGGDRVFVPLLLSGKSTSPSVSLDTGRLTAAARQAAEAKLKEQKDLLLQQGKDRAGKVLTGVLAGPDSSRTGSVRKTIENDVKDRLGKLFGR